MDDKLCIELLCRKFGSGGEAGRIISGNPLSCKNDIKNLKMGFWCLFLCLYMEKGFVRKHLCEWKKKEGSNHPNKTKRR